MLIERRKEGKSLILTLLGKRLDAQAAEDFKENMTAFIKNNKAIVLDLSLVDFMDSSGLGAIVFALKLMGNEGSLVLSGLQKPVLDLFWLTHMGEIFSIYPDASIAAASQ